MTASLVFRDIDHSFCRYSLLNMLSIAYIHVFIPGIFVFPDASFTRCRPDTNPSVFLTDAAKIREVD
jgi:hypothetical protein